LHFLAAREHARSNGGANDLYAVGAELNTPVRIKACAIGAVEVLRGGSSEGW